MKSMSYAPQQDWSAYRDMTKNLERDIARRLTMEQRFDLYADLFRMVCCPKASAIQRDRIEQQRWTQKLALRLKWNSIYQATEQDRRG